MVRTDSVAPLNLQWTREIVPASRGLLSARDIHRALIHDADILRQLGGNYSQVTAVRSGSSEAGYSMVTVTLAGNRLPTATWTARPAERQSFELSIPTSAGTIALRGCTAAGELPAGDGGRITASGTHAVVERIRSAGETDVAKAILEHFAGAASGTAAPPEWTDLLRATEIVEAAERSVRRRRTIDLHFETTSERNQFKTQMTAIGCGLMSMTLVSLIVALMAGAPFNVHPMVMKVARVGIFVPLGVFLLLQLLLFVSRPSKEEH